MSRRKRILLLSEASYLSTGYATYSRELLKRLHNSGKYDVAELSVYGSVDDPKRSTIPWKNYPNLPCNDEDKKVYHANPIHQFGSWRFERACLDFKPDVVFGIKDYWMDVFVKNSPFRRIFKFCWMPTVDAAPQNEEWVSAFAESDGVLTYSKFAFKQLQKQAGNSINLLGVSSPSASEEFAPGNKEQAKTSLGINPEHRIIGTVMRNQRRKLYPALFSAFRKYLDRTGDTNTYLYCHTGYPDNGWDFPKLLIEYGLTSKVYFTYKCKCGFFGAFKFSDIVQQCPKCKNFQLATTNVNEGLSTRDLARVYQSFDLYCQAANSEGFGIPAVEAAACGVPVCCTDYSAMEDFPETLGAIPIKPKAFYNELETGCLRAVIDEDHLATVFEEFFFLPEELRNIKGRQTRLKFEENYSWDRTTKLWADFVDSVDYADWTIPPFIVPNFPELPKFTNNKELVDWVFGVASIEGRLLNSYEHLGLLRDLNFNISKRGTCGYIFSESTLFDQENYHPVNNEILLNILNSKINMNNFWERARAGMISLNSEAWL